MFSFRLSMSWNMRMSSNNCRCPWDKNESSPWAWAWTEGHVIDAGEPWRTGKRHLAVGVAKLESWWSFWVMCLDVNRSVIGCKTSWLKERWLGQIEWYLRYEVPTALIYGEYKVQRRRRHSSNIQLGMLSISGQRCPAWFSKAGSRLRDQDQELQKKGPRAPEAS